MKLRHLLIATTATGLLVGGAAKAAPITVKYAPLTDNQFLHFDVQSGPWSDAPAVPIAMMPQAITTPSKFQASITEINVRAAHNGHLIAIAVDWADPTQSDSNVTDVFSDGVAIGFPTKDPALTSPFMGNVGSPVEIIHWKALWQRDVDKGFTDVKDYFPNTFNDVYYMNKGPNNDRSTPDEMATPEGRESLPAMALGNDMAQPQRQTPVEQLMAEGFGTLTAQKRQDATGKGVYANGRWHVVFFRQLNTGDPLDAPFAPGGKTVLNAAVWEGGVGDVGARKNYAMWNDVVLEPGEAVKPASSGHH